jgi:hypothetical protein
MGIAWRQYGQCPFQFAAACGLFANTAVTEARLSSPIRRRSEVRRDLEAFINYYVSDASNERRNSLGWLCS